MRPQQVGVRQVGQDVSVEDQEVRRQAVQDRDDRTHRAERLGLKRVVTLEAPLLAGSNVGPDELAEVTYGERHAPKPACRQLTQDDLQDGAVVADGHQRLGNGGGVRPQPRALAAGQDDRVHIAHRVYRLHL